MNQQWLLMVILRIRTLPVMQSRWDNPSNQNLKHCHQKLGQLKEVQVTTTSKVNMEIVSMYSTDTDFLFRRARRFLIQITDQVELICYLAIYLFILTVRVPDKRILENACHILSCHYISTQTVSLNIFSKLQLISLRNLLIRKTGKSVCLSF